MKRDNNANKDNNDNANKDNNDNANKDNNDNSKVVQVVFVSLLLDLLAFTMILPLLPALLDHYRQMDDDGLYSMILRPIQKMQVYLNVPDKFNSVLFGGFLGSMYSFLQFLSSPIVGALSDVYGRKILMLWCLTGIAISHLLWAVSSNFGIFVCARIIGGISKGNVSLSMAIISDVTSSKSRGRAMALVGIAFSIGFVVGPMIGATFSRMYNGQSEGQWSAIPALFALFLGLSDLIYVMFNLKESLPQQRRASSLARGVSNALIYINPVDLFQFNCVSGLAQHELQSLRKLGRAYFLYLFVYSGLEFTLTFLTHHLFRFSSMQQGWMFLGIGLTMAILQGGWVRRIPAYKTKAVTELGLWLIVPSFVCIGIAKDPPMLYFGVFLFAVSTAMVVTCMMTLVTRIGQDSQRGVITGIFRSLGALARACGPIVTSLAFWSAGSMPTYLTGALALIIPPFILRSTQI